MIMGKEERRAFIEFKQDLKLMLPRDRQAELAELTYDLDTIIMSGEIDEELRDELLEKTDGLRLCINALCGLLDEYQYHIFDKEDE